MRLNITLPWAFVTRAYLEERLATMLTREQFNAKLAGAAATIGKGIVIAIAPTIQDEIKRQVAAQMAAQTAGVDYTPEGDILDNLTSAATSAAQDTLTSLLTPTPATQTQTDTSGNTGDAATPETPLKAEQSDPAP